MANKPYEEPKKKRRQMKRFRLDEISLVDRPAQEGAKVVITKRAEPTEKALLKPNPGEKKSDFISRFMGDAKAKEEYPEEKQRLAVANQKFGKSFEEMSAPALTSAHDGHQHLLDDAGNFGRTSYDRSKSKEFGHMHHWVRNESGEIIIALSEGHGHSMLDLSKSEINDIVKSGKVSDNTDKDLRDGDSTDLSKDTTSVDNGAGSTGNGIMDEQTKAKLDELEKRAEKAEAIAALSPEQRKHFETLKSEGQDKFLSKSEVERSEVMKSLQDADPVVYTARDGREFRKSADRNLLAEVQRNDSLEEKLEKSEQRAQRASFEKRATEELGHLKGSTDAKTDLLEAVSKIQDEGRREKVLEIVKSKDAGMALALSRVGHSGSDDTSGPEQVISDIAKRLQEKNPELTPEIAYAKALATPEGLEAFKTIRNEEN